MRNLLHFSLGILIALGHCLAQDNLIQNADFEQGPWEKQALKGTGAVEVKQAEDKGNYLLVVGAMPDARVQALSKKITVNADNEYQFDFSYKLAYTNATVTIRWDNGGLVYNLDAHRAGLDWAALPEGLASKIVTGIQYMDGLGAPTGRTNWNKAVVHFPSEIKEVQISVMIWGQGSIAIRNISLTAAEGGSSQPAKSDSGVSAANREELQRLLVGKKDPDEGEKKSPGNFKLEIQDFSLPEKYTADFSRYPDSTKNIRIQGDGFYRNGKPEFLIGVESNVLVYPALYRLLGVDFVHINDTCFMGTIQCKKNSGTVTLSWKPYDLLQANLERLMESGLAAYVQPIEEKIEQFNPKNFPFYEEFPELFVNNSHFVNFRFEDPNARRIRENMWRSFMGISRQYPIFAYELFNEVAYLDYSPANVAGFRQAMEAKYGTITKANQAWGTTYDSFEKMTPPKGHGNLINLPPKLSYNQWVDWQKYIEKVLGAGLQEVSRFVKSVDRNPNVYTTVQSTCNLQQDYSGGSGVYPPLKALSEDIYGDEGGGGVWINQDGEDNFKEIKYMLRPYMNSDLVTFIAAGKPLMDQEIGLSGIGRSPIPETRVTELHGNWKFIEDNAKQGQANGYEKTDCDEKAWSDLQVPGLWGKQGFPQCHHGWYRRTFNISEKLKKQKIYINGSKLSDYARIYINGTKVLETQSWDEVFSREISPLLNFGSKNTIAVEIANNYQSAGMYWGGIRDYLSLDSCAYSANDPMRRGQMRSLLWGKLVHGKSAIFLSYAYATEGGRLSMFNPTRVSPEAIRAIPAVKKEMEAVGDIALSEHHQPGAVGLCYSLESGRARLYPGYEDWTSGHATSDLADYYAALLFGQNRPSVVDNDSIVAGRCDQFKALLFRMCERVRGGTLEKLEEYVKKGGIVIIDHGSLAINDDTHETLNIEALTGIKVGAPIMEPRKIKSNDFLPENVMTVAREFDKATGRIIKPITAIPEILYENGTPALTVNHLGNGLVYYIAAEFTQGALRNVITSILKKRGIGDSQILIEPNEGEKRGLYIESRLFGSAGKGYLAYVLNWGSGPLNVRLKFPSLPDGKYRVRRIIAGGNPESQKSAASELRAGIPLEIPSQDPILLLIEKDSVPARPYPETASDRIESLSRLMAPSPKSDRRVLIDGSRGENMTKVRMLTAVQLLEKNGIEVNTGLDIRLLPSSGMVMTAREKIGLEKLAEYQSIVFLGGNEESFSTAEIEAIKKYVENGGSLLLSANYVTGPHGWLYNDKRAKLAQAFGLDFTNTNVRESDNYLYKYPYYGCYSSAAEHPITRRVSKIQSLGMSVLKVANAKARILLVSSDTAEPANAPTLVAFEFGKGRVVMMGDANWLQPELLMQLDNGQLCLNIFRWLMRDEDKIETITADLKKQLTVY